MQKLLFKKPEIPNFADPLVQQAFVAEIASQEELLQKEINVNLAEQSLVKRRMQLTKEFLEQLPIDDPQYSMLIAQIQMDQVELDELKGRELALSQKVDLMRQP